MTRPRRIRRLALALALTAGALLAASALAQGTASAATPAVTSSARSAAFVPRWPAQVYAPYFETWTTDSIPAIAAKSGAKYLSLAFIQTPKAGSCTMTWNGTRTQPVPGPRYQAQIAQLRRMGGDVVPTFGGLSADSTGTEIADSCIRCTRSIGCGRWRGSRSCRASTTTRARPRSPTCPTRGVS